MRYLPGLNAVRFYAALCVMMVHATSDPRLLPFTLNGPDSVTLFFVLSGYLITYRLLIERQRAGQIDLKAFYIRRELRILPLYFLIVFLSAFVLPLIGTKPVVPSAFVGALLLSPHLAHAVMDQGLGAAEQLWSIGVEEWFYALWPVLVRRFSVGLLCVAIIVVWTGYGLATSSGILAFAREIRFECMAVGALAAWLVVKQSRWLYVLYHPAVQIAVILLLLSMVMADMVVPLYDLTFSTLVAIFLLNISTNRRSLVRLEWPWSKAAGDLTYGIYVWHYPVVRVLEANGVPESSRLIPTVLVTLALAFLSYRFFERPFLRLKDRFEPRSQAITVAVTGD